MLWESKNLMTGRVRTGRGEKIAGFFALLGVISFLAQVPPAAPAQAALPYPRGDGIVRIYNYHLNEFAEVRFRNGQTLIPEGLAQVNALLRSRDNAEQAPIDPRLVDLIDHIQDHFQVDTIEIISGYRRKEFNDSLLKNGHTVSPVSLHTKGEALDIHIDEIREETLRDYALSLGLGGVGYYGPLDFVHLDVGLHRKWGEGWSGGRKLVGVLQPKAPVQLTSDRNDYLPNETLLFTWSGEGLDQVKDLHLERFRRGQWKSCSAQVGEGASFQLPASDLKCESDAAPFGKFRWVFRLPGNPEPLSSNEFYLKKI